MGSCRRSQFPLRNNVQSRKKVLHQIYVRANTMFIGEMRAACFILIVWALLATCGAELMSKVTFVTTKVWPCTEKTSNDIVFRNTKLYKINRDQFIDAEIESKIPFDDKLQLMVKCFYWVNGGFKPRLSMPLGGVCSGLKTTMPTMFKSLTNTVHRSDCPLPPANYSLKKWPSTTEFSLPVPAGRYKSTMYFSNNGKIVGCVGGEVNAVPKKKN